MNRIGEIKKYAEEYIIGSIYSHIEEDRKYLYQHADEVKSALALRMRQILSNDKGINKVVICYLYSSIAMKRQELCIIPFMDMPFVMQLENEIYIEYSEILGYSIMEEDHLERILRNKFVQLLPYEIEEIIREYMYRYSEKIGELLSEILCGGEEGIKVFFGSYMGEVKEIGRIVL